MARSHPAPVILCRAILLKTWLFSIVLNEAKGRLRKRKREAVAADHTVAGELFADGRFLLSDGHWARSPALWHDNSPEALLGREISAAAWKKHWGACPASSAAC